MDFRRAEVGILLIICSNFPFFGVPFAGFLFFSIPWFIFPSADPMTMYSFFCTLTIIGLILLMSDRKGFLRRMKGNKIVSALLIIFGLILIVAGFLALHSTLLIREYYNTKVPGHSLTLEESTIYLLAEVWEVLASFSGIVWIFYGMMAWGYKETDE